jgi:hypothetical protein
MSSSGMLRRVAFVRIDVSGNVISRLRRISELEIKLEVTSN